MRQFLTVDRAQVVRSLRLEEGVTWRSVGEACIELWDLEFGKGDTQSVGATLCHVAAELLREDPDNEPWN